MRNKIKDLRYRWSVDEKTKNPRVGAVQRLRTSMQFMPVLLKIRAGGGRLARLGRRDSVISRSTEARPHLPQSPTTVSSSRERELHGLLPRKTGSH